MCCISVQMKSAFLHAYVGVAGADLRHSPPLALLARLGCPKRREFICNNAGRSRCPVRATRPRGGRAVRWARSLRRPQGFPGIDYTGVAWLNIARPAAGPGIWRNVSLLSSNCYGRTPLRRISRGDLILRLSRSSHGHCCCRRSALLHAPPLQGLEAQCVGEVVEVFQNLVQVAGSLLLDPLRGSCAVLAKFELREPSCQPWERLR
mmetsp:Transcript_52357/g.113459  ORF Transcript_52357/g.113459 Transcript_52357/m.113459 type:complete len:206 (+) Transcript_52357:164-781(+)